MQAGDFRRVTAGCAVAMALVVSPESLRAQKPAPDKATQDSVLALAKKTQNPVADLMSFPFQFNFNSGGGLTSGDYLNLNFQPVVPIHVTPRLNLIARTIVPINSYPVSADEKATGLGDIQEQLFFSPTGHKITFGFGPVLSFPVATNPAFRTGSWAAGPAAVVLVMPGHWVIGSLFTQLWTYADNANGSEINLFLWQPFINYNIKNGWALAFAPIITANWEAESGQEWTVPLGIGFAKTTHFGRRPIVVGAQYYRNVVRPDAGPGNQLRFQLSLLYPQAPRR